MSVFFSNRLVLFGGLILASACSGTMSGPDGGDDRVSPGSDAPMPMDAATEDGSGGDTAVFDAATDAGGGPDVVRPPLGSGRTVLFNFRVTLDSPDRVYFDSTGDIGGLTREGFVISDREIVNLSVTPGETEGHFFTVDAPFTYWDHNTIRLGEIDGSRSGDGTVPNFELQYIVSAFPRPEPSGNEYFVDASASAGGDGRSAASALRTIGEGIQALSTDTGAGGTLWIKTGTYPETIREDAMRGLTGSADRPIYISGYRETPGDNPTQPIRYPDDLDLDPSLMPLILNSTEFGLPIKGTEYVIVQNLSVQDSTRQGVYVSGGARLTVVENIFVNNRNSTGVGFLQNHRGDTRLKFLNNVIMEAQTDLLRTSGSRNLHDGNRVYSATGRGGNYAYYFSGSESILRNLEVRVGGRAGQHGFALKGDNNPAEHNLLENSQIWGQTAGMEARHVEVRFNVYRNVLVRSEPSQVNDASISACNVWGGASYNVFDRIHHVASRFFANILYSASDDLVDRIGHHNIFKNSVIYLDPFNDTPRGSAFVYVRGDDSDAENGVAHDNHFFNNTVYGVTHLYRTTGGDVIRDDVVTNNVFVGIQMNDATSAVALESNVFWENSFPTPAGMLEMNPMFADPSNQDFGLQEGSPLSDLGSDLENVVFDFTGRIRPPGAISIGAFERD